MTTYTEKEVTEIGRRNGETALEHCDVGPNETREEAAFKAEQNARQFTGHLNNAIMRNPNLYAAYESGVKEGITGEID